MRQIVVLFFAFSVFSGSTALCQGWSECAGLPDNELAALNCDFSEGVDHWTFVSAMGLWAADGGDGHPSSPCGRAQASDPGSYSFTIASECLLVDAATNYALGFYTSTPGGATIGCVARVEEYTTDNCAGTPNLSPDGPFIPQLNVWAPSTVVWPTSVGVQSARGVVECSADASFTVLFDNAAMVRGSVVPVELQEFRIE